LTENAILSTIYSKIIVFKLKYVKLNPSQKNGDVLTTQSIGKESAI